MGKEISGIDRDVFIAFCSRLMIPSKEGDYRGSGETLVPLIPLRTQLYLLDQILEGLSRGIHFFVVLKCRQSGVTTLGLAFDLYWCFRHDGVILNFIADIGTRTQYNRKLLRDFVKSLSKHPDWRQEVDDDNREMITFQNRSCIIWNNANTRDTGGLGVGTGVMCAHATEVGRFKDEEGMASLLSSLSTRNPNRFYLFESTAHGPTLFRDMCDEAAQPGNTSQKFIFIGWWLQPDYDLDLKVPEHLERFKTYWETFPRANQEEVVWADAVERRYGWKITPTQFAWWRYHLKELKFNNLELMYQEYPPLPEYAWRYGGHTFISGNKLMVRRVLAEKCPVRPRYFQFAFSDNFEETTVHEVDPKQSWHDLTTWDEPKQGRGVRYCIGVDPSHGASEEGDHACIQVWRCYSDKAVQVAEFVRRELPTYHLAWAILHLAGTYNSETLLNVELQGGGFAVMEQLQRLQREQEIRYNPALARYFENLNHYVYYRPDSIRRAFGSFHWRTTPDSKDRMLSCFRDFFEQGIVEIRSLKLIKEIEGIQRLKDGTIEPPREDHRLMASCIAAMAYVQCIETDLGGTDYTEAYFKTEQKAKDGTITPSEVLTTQILNWRDAAIERDAQIQAAKVAPKWARERYRR